MNLTPYPLSYPSKQPLLSERSSMLETKTSSRSGRAAKQESVFDRIVNGSTSFSCHDLTFSDYFDQKE